MWEQGHTAAVLILYHSTAHGTSLAPRHVARPQGVFSLLPTM